jgi:hypothetical protein
VGRTVVGIGEVGSDGKWPGGGPSGLGRLGSDAETTINRARRKVPDKLVTRLPLPTSHCFSLTSYSDTSSPWVAPGKPKTRKLSSTHTSPHTSATAKKENARSFGSSSSKSGSSVGPFPKFQPRSSRSIRSRRPKRFGRTGSSM